MGQPNQFISPEQWGALQGTVSLFNQVEVLNTDGELPQWLFELRDQLQQLVVAATEPIQPFKVSQHFLYLLDLYLAGAVTQDEVADGTQLVLEWCRQTLESAERMGLRPKQDGDQAIYLVISNVGGND